MQLRINVSDWEEAYLRQEPDLSSEDAIIERSVHDGLSCAELARLLIVARQRKDVGEDVLPPNKTLLQNGGTLGVNALFQRMKASIEAKGRTINLRALVGPVREHEETDDDETVTLESEAPAIAEGDYHAGFARFDDPLAGERAERYLLTRVPGYIWGRLPIVYAAGGNVQAVADELKASIDEMVNRLV